MAELATLHHEISLYNSLAQEWLETLFALYSGNNPAYVDLLARINFIDTIHSKLGIFVPILTAKQCSNLLSLALFCVEQLCQATYNPLNLW